MSWRVLLLVGAGIITGSASWVMADVFEHVRTSDTLLREALRDDRSRYYFLTSGVMREPQEKPVSSIKKLGVDGLVRQPGLYDTETAFDRYLKKELTAGQIPKNDLSLTHPLILLEYSSPVMADVIKHYRMSAYERLNMEQARLDQIKLSTENRADRLSRQSVRECLERNADKGLVEAMRVCMRATDPFDALVSVDGLNSLQDGRRRIHVLEQALERLGLDKGRVVKVVALSGDKVIADSGYEEVFPEKSYVARIQEERQRLTKLWHETLDKFQTTGRAGPAALEELSLSGSPVMLRTLFDLVAVNPAWAETGILKLASVSAKGIILGQYQQAADYLGLCQRDPVLPEEFQRVVSEKRDFLLEVVRGNDHAGSLTVSHQALLADLARAADNARWQRRGIPEVLPAEDVKVLMLDQ
ncbi:MAG: hypothetical protein V2A70_01575 [Candidatus Omnitrophota bacterium]